MKEYLKHLLIRTPLEKPIKRIQTLISIPKHYKHPELSEIYIEGKRTEQAIKRIISKSSNCIDIGCHLGSMLSEIVRLAPDGHHTAFEAVPYKAHWLKQKFPDVDIKNMALSDTVGEVSFYINKYRSGYSGLHANNLKQNEKIEKITVQCERLDNVLSAERPIDFIKIDVEGAELAVLRGATETLSRYQPILLFECTRFGLSSFEFTSSQIFEFLTKQHSYSILLIKDFLNNQEPLSFEKFDKALQYPFQGFNFIAVPNLKY